MSFEKPGDSGLEESEISPDEAIAAANTFEALYDALRAVGEIEGSSKTYDAEELIELIRDFQEGNRLINEITRTHGLRNKVSELIDSLET
tara:strand:- start:1333 stop:1602 length:270 start_codon:yes stop_codon:yes gene_type:complete